jgi:hypothetical protein
MGHWSTYARAGETTPLYVLSTLKAAGVSEVLDTPQGFRILKRDPDKRRDMYAAASLAIPYETPSSPGAPPRDEALAIAQRILESARKRPETFDALRQQHCDYDLCKQPLVFSEGPGVFSATIDSIRRAQLGELVDQVLDTSLGYVIVRREDPASYPARAKSTVNFELPRPPMPTLETASTGELLWYVASLSRLSPARSWISLGSSDRHARGNEPR